MAEPVLTVVPARGGSKRIPRKNVRDFGGHPLIAHTLQEALKCEFIDRVHVSTEDDEIAGIARDYGARVPRRRPEHLATDDAGVIDVVLDLLEYLEQRGRTYETLIILLASSPLKTAEDIRRTYAAFQSEDVDYARAVTSFFYPPWQAMVEEDGYLRPYFQDVEAERKSQQVPEPLVDSGCVYVCDVEVFRREQTLYGDRLVGYRMPPERAIDIDEPFQFKLAELLYRNREEPSP